MSIATRRPTLVLSTRTEQCSSAPDRSPSDPSDSPVATSVTNPAASVATSDHQPSSNNAFGTRAVPSADLQNLEWLRTNSALYRFYSFTVTFKDSSVGSKSSKFVGIYEGFVRDKITELMSYPHGAPPMMFTREYSDVPTTSNKNHPHHIHAVIGIPIPANHDRLLKKYKNLAHRKSRVIADVELRPLPTHEDVRRCYWYMRNHNINKKPFQ